MLDTDLHDKMRRDSSTVHGYGQPAAGLCKLSSADLQGGGGDDFAGAHSFLLMRYLCFERAITWHFHALIESHALQFGWHAIGTCTTFAQYIYIHLFVTVVQMYPCSL